MELKYQILRGDIHVPNTKKAVIGAHIAQVEMGDFLEPNVMVYPPYFPNWDSGISHIIRKEHSKLKGIKTYSHIKAFWGDDPLPNLAITKTGDYPVLNSEMAHASFIHVKCQWQY